MLCYTILCYDNCQTTSCPTSLASQHCQPAQSSQLAHLSKTNKKKKKKQARQQTNKETAGFLSVSTKKLRKYTKNK
jgi:hypothetical protein